MTKEEFEALEDHARGLGFDVERKHWLPDGEGGLREETFEENTRRLKAVYGTRSCCLKDGLQICDLRPIQLGIRVTYTESRSRSVKPGNIEICIIEHDPRPWWKFWGK